MNAVSRSPALSNVAFKSSRANGDSESKSPAQDGRISPNGEFRVEHAVQYCAQQPNRRSEAFHVSSGLPRRGARDQALGWLALALTDCAICPPRQRRSSCGVKTLSPVISNKKETKEYEQYSGDARCSHCFV